MSAAALALSALLLALALSMTTRINVGLVAIVLAWVIGVYAAHMKLDAVLTGFPASLFLTLAGVTFLFAVAKSNGTLDVLALRAARMVRGNSALLPPLFFVLAGLLATVGPGAVASVALVAPIAMPIGASAGVPNLLSAIMIGTGANAGNLSPISAVGAMVNTLLAKQGLGGHEWRVWSANFLAHVIVAAAAYLLLGGLRLARKGRVVEMVEVLTPPLDGRQWLTIAVTTAWMLAVVLLRVHVGLAAFGAGTLLLLARAADERDAIARIPLDIILMVCGVTMLIGVLEATGGMELFTGLIARIANARTINAVIAFVTGAISTYSSTSGVVLPAFLPMAPGLVRQVGGGDPLAVALSINVGSSLVDVSPLSTIGALCVAAVADRAAAKDLFNRLLIFGVSMIVVGALLAGLFATSYARM